MSALALGLVACAGEKGELVLALQTDMSLPEDVDTVNIEVKVGATPVHDGEYILDPGAAGSYRMPATLGIVAGEDANAIVEVKVTALRTVNGVREARTVNKSITTVPEDRVALLRVPIQWLSTGDEFVVALPNDGDEPVEYDTACPPVDGRPQSALAGECQDAEVSSGNLPDFEASQVYGGAEDPGSAGTCFPTEDCFDSGFTVAPLPRTSTERDCIVEVALQSDEILNFACITPMPAAGATRGGICGANDCYVPLDRDDRLGWRELALPGEGDVDTPSELRSTGRLRRYRLPTAVCDRVDSGRALGVVASTSDACAVTKTLRYPTCGPWSSVGKGGTPDFGPDADGDTFPGSESGGPDCNDRDDTIYPGAPEACDGKDNDCDGMVDDSCVMQLPFSHHVDLSGTSDFVSNARYAIYQSFTSSNPLDLDQRTVTFVPNEAGTSYAVSTGPLAWDGDEGSLLVPPSGSSDPSNCDDCYASLNLSTPFTFYGASYDVLFPSSNGYLTFVAGDSTYTESVETFLQGSPRISALFDDLDTRGDATVGDEILAFTSEEKTVVTYRNIQHFSNSGTSNTFQFALHADGTIQISYDGIEDVATGNLVGISPGSITDGGTGGTGGMTGSGGTGGAGGTGGTSGTGGSGGNAGACSFSAATVADTTYCADVAVDDVGLFQLSCVEDACQCCTSDACTPISLTPLEVCTSEDHVRSVLMSECIAGAACGEGCPVTTPGNGAACDSSTIASCTFDDGNFCECVDDSFSCAF